MRAIFKILEKIIIISLTIWFVRWYIKGHFGKWALFFWLNTIIAVCIYLNAKSNTPKEDNTPGYVYWERNVKNH